MKLTVRITGILEAELELPEPGGVAPLGVANWNTANWNTWHGNQYTEAKNFIHACVDDATRIIQQQAMASEE